MPRAVIGVDGQQVQAKQSSSCIRLHSCNLQLKETFYPQPSSSDKSFNNDEMASSRDIQSEISCVKD